MSPWLGMSYGITLSGGDATVASYKGDDFRERGNAAANARKAAVERYRAQPSADDPVVLERQAALRATREARELRVAERKAAREAEAARLAAEQSALDAERIAREAELAARNVALEAERKAARDARYAARKKRR